MGRWFLIKVFVLSRNWPLFFRKIIYKTAGFKNVEIKRGVFFDSYSNVQLGENVFINYGVDFYTSGKACIRVKDNVNIGPNVHLCCATHEIGPSDCRAGKGEYLDITIGEGAWICMDSVILPGVTIGPGSIIAAGSVVTKDVPPNELWGGVPARRIKSLN